MPYGDGTGPAGQGPMTGRGAGYCAGYGAPGYANPIPGRGFWGRGGRGRGFWGRGGGRGFRHQYYATGLPGWARAGYGRLAWGGPAVYPPPGAAYSGPDKEQELQMLKDQADYFTEALDGIKKRIDELESKTGENE
ncbi:MAG: DUF5320 domain-containing protein [bacterium]